MGTRELDIVLFGATGFTGRLTAEHLVRAHLREGVRLALAGRSREKLERVRGELSALDPRASELPLLVAEAHDRAALDRITARAAVVATSVGPFGRLGASLVASCAASGTHYADLTGEVPFVRRSIDQNHAEAARTGARIVHSAGFDSVPSDLGTFFVIERYRERFGVLPEAVTHLVVSTRGGLSGGTIASMAGIFEEAQRDRAIRRLLADPFALVDGPHPEADSDSLSPRWEPLFAEWTGPFFMASINTRIVRRSLSLLGAEARGGYERVRYDERMGTGRGGAGLARAGLIGAALSLGMGALAVPPIRRLATRTLLPAPGEGPSAEQRARGSFASRFLASGPAGTLRARLRGEGDPGYAATARMLGESAMCLAFDALDAKGGVRTPASTMAAPLIARLRDQRITLDPE